MKKVLLTAVAVFAFGFTNAQKVKFGVKAGLNNTSLKVDSNVGTTKSSFGFHIGGLAEYKFNDKMGLQPELLFSQEGGDYKFDDNLFGTPISYNQKFKITKISLPIMFKYYVIKNLSIEAGPQLDYVLKVKSDATLDASTVATLKSSSDFSGSSSTVYNTNNTNGSTTSDIAYQDYGLKKLNFAFNLGAGYELPMGLFFQARYSLGITKFVENANFMAAKDAYGDKVLGTGNPAIDNKYDNTSFKTSNMQISVGYKF